MQNKANDNILETIDLTNIRTEFPILDQKINGKPLIYFDNAATTQKPKLVIDSLINYYTQINSNIHRGIHTLAERSTSAFEETRETAQRFINSGETEEIIFVKGTTEGVNLVASTYGRKYVGEGDEIIISGLEHHSNIVPWQMLCEEKGAVLKIIPVNDHGELILEEYDNLLSEKTKVVSLSYASNTLGTINPVKTIISKAHKMGAVVFVDGAQAAPHLEIDVQDMDCDFFTFSGHKIYGPTGTGVLYGKRELLEKMPPYQGGGEMIKEVTFSKTTFNDIPFKFEAGTPNIGDIVAFKNAMNFITRIGKNAIKEHEDDLLAHSSHKLSQIDGVKLVGTAKNKVSVNSFTVENIHHFDIGMMLDANGIAVRTGHHCTQPLMDQFGIEGTVRASFAVYNTKNEIDQFVDSLARIVKLMR